MFGGTVVGASVGSMAVAAVAVLMAFFQLWFFLKKPEFAWNGWGALMSFSTFVYATAVFVQYNVGPGGATRLAELFQYTAFLLIVYGVYGFTFAYFSLPGKRFIRLFGAFHLLLLIPMWTTPWVIGDTFVSRHFLLLQKPYVEPAPSPLSTVYVLYAAGAAVYSLRLWFRHRKQTEKHTSFFIVGLFIWAAMGVSDMLGTLGVPTALFIMEYGFLAFSLSVLLIAGEGYLDLFELSRQREEKYRSVLENIREGYYELDLSGNFTFGNPALSDIFGRPVEDLIGKNGLDFSTPETAGRLREAYRKVFDTGDPTWVLRYEILRPQGPPGNVETSAYLMRDRDGRPSGFRGIIRDVTEKVAAEKEREDMEERLRQAQRREALGTLAGGVAHDFNNLLMGIQGNVSLMLLKAPPGSEDHERLSGIEDHVRDATGLTRQLLGFARGGKFEVRTTDVNELVKKTSAMFGRTRKEITVHASLSPVWPVEADRGQIEQVLVNLYVNAWQAMPGQGDIFLSTENTEVDAAGAERHGVAPGRYVKINVRDTGSGMDEETRKKIFDPFFTTKDMSRGTGLGLASALGIIRSHKGVILVESRPTEGSTFSILLPASEKPVTVAERPPAGVLRGTETILLVDDEKVILDTEARVLEALGYKVLAADGGPKALEIYRQDPAAVDLVILDMIMPGEDGEKVCQKLKAANPGVRILFSSGYSASAKADRIMEMGCNGFIQKPFDLEQISWKIREILDRKR